jgi:hypothetical protein
MRRGWSALALTPWSDQRADSLSLILSCWTIATFQLTRCLLRKVEMTDPHEPSLGPDVWPAVDGFHKSGRRNSVNALSPPLNGDLEHRSAGQAPAGLGL